MAERKDLGIYIHIPFCVKKCLYCDFLSDVAESGLKEQYLDALLHEIGYTALNCIDFKSQYCVKSIFLGGGTPSILTGAQIKRILSAVRDRFDVSSDAEITIECNPATADLQKLKQFREAGINRISIGLQSANDKELKLLGRVHDLKQFYETYENAREAGFKNINIDLISAVPGQTPESYEDTLKKVLELKPEHISAYSLIVEPDTPYYEIYSQDDGSTNPGSTGCDCEIKPPSGIDAWPPLPDEDTEREMYYLTERVLDKAGYHRYEISNYSRPGYECRHNIAYWTGVDYIGLGVGAAGYINGVRYSNTSDIYTYMNACRQLDKIPSEVYYAEAEDDSDDPDEPVQSEYSRTESMDYLTDEKYHEAIQRLSANEKMEEYMFLGLRMMDGISCAEFEERFGISIGKVYDSQIEKLKNEGLLTVSGDNIRLTGKGIDVSNVVLANFLL